MAQQAHVEIIELFDPAADRLRNAAGLLIRTLELLLAQLLLVKEHVAQQRYPGQRDDEGREDQKRNGQAEVLEHHARHAGGKTQRQEHRNCGER